MKLGDIFDRSFKLTGKTYGRSFIIAALILIPTSLLFALALQNFFSVFSELGTLGSMSSAEAREFGMSLARNIPLLALGGLLLAVGMIAARQAVTLVTCSEFAGEQMTWQEALGLTFRSRLWKALGQNLLAGLALGALFVIPYGTVLVAVLSKQTVFMIIGVLMFFPAFALGAYLLIKWLFTGIVIAYENSGVMDSFRRSSFLVQGEWWRVLGIMLLLSIIAQFAISLITTPIQVVGMLGFYQKYFEFLRHIGTHAQPDPSEMLGALSSMGPAIAISTAVSSILSAVLTPSYMSVMYFDLRARKNEFVEFGQEYNPDEKNPA